jgi:hypothetical protein
MCFAESPLAAGLLVTDSDKTRCVCPCQQEQPTESTYRGVLWSLCLDALDSVPLAFGLAAALTLFCATIILGR